MLRTAALRGIQDCRSGKRDFEKARLRWLDTVVEGTGHTQSGVLDAERRDDRCPPSADAL
jgi:hypothetical protein